MIAYFFICNKMILETVTVILTTVINICIVHIQKKTKEHVCMLHNEMRNHKIDIKMLQSKQNNVLDLLNNKLSS